MAISGKPTYLKGQRFFLPGTGVAEVVFSGPETIAGLECNVVRVAFPDLARTVLSSPMERTMVIGKDGQTPLRPLPGPADIKAAMAVLARPQTADKRIWSRRASDHEEKLKSGNLADIAAVYRDTRRTTDKQSFSEKEIMDKALSLLAGVMAEATGADLPDVHRHLDGVANRTIAPDAPIAKAKGAKQKPQAAVVAASAEENTPAGFVFSVDAAKIDTSKEYTNALRVDLAASTLGDEDRALLAWRYLYRTKDGAELLETYRKTNNLAASQMAGRINRAASLFREWAKTSPLPRAYIGPLFDPRPAPPPAAPRPIPAKPDAGGNGKAPRGRDAIVNDDAEDDLRDHDPDVVLGAKPRRQKQMSHEQKLFEKWDDFVSEAQLNPDIPNAKQLFDEARRIFANRPRDLVIFTIEYLYPEAARDAVLKPVFVYTGTRNRTAFKAMAKKRFMDGCRDIDLIKAAHGIFRDGRLAATTQPGSDTYPESPLPYDIREQIQQKLGSVDISLQDLSDLGLFVSEKLYDRKNLAAAFAAPASGKEEDKITTLRQAYLLIKSHPVNTRRHELREQFRQLDGPLVYDALQDIPKAMDTLSKDLRTLADPTASPRRIDAIKARYTVNGRFVLDVPI